MKEKRSPNFPTYKIENESEQTKMINQQGMVKVNKINYSNHFESTRKLTFVWSYLTQGVTVSCRWYFVFGKLHQ